MNRLHALSTLPDAMATEPLGLVIGLASEEAAMLGGATAAMRMEVLPYALIHAALARAPWAECVITPLMAEQFDAMDMAVQLDLAGYDGVYMVVTPRVPRPEIVHREISQLCPKVTVRLIQKAPH